MVFKHCKFGTFHWIQNSGNFGWYIKWNKLFQFTIWPEYSRPALMVVHFDCSGHFGWSDQKVPFHLTKLLSPVPLSCILLMRTITKCMVAWVASVQPECAVPLGMWNFRNCKPDFLLNYGKRPNFQFLCQSRINWGFWVSDHLPLA